MQEEALEIQVEGIELVGRVCWPEKGPGSSSHKNAPLLILCHGIPGSKPDQKTVEEDGGYPALAERCCREGFPVFYFNFRGTGESGGNFDLSGWKRDLAAWLDYWEKREPGRAFWLWGFSGGAAVSACVAARDPRVRAALLAACPAHFDGLFRRDELEGIIDRFRDLGIIREAGFPPDPEQWLKDILSINPEQCIEGAASRPLLLVHGSEDDIVPLEHAFRLQEKTGGRARLIIVPGAGHQLRKEEKAVANCLEWMKQLTKNNFL